MPLTLQGDTAKAAKFDIAEANGADLAEFRRKVFFEIILARPFANRRHVPYHPFYFAYD